MSNDKHIDEPAEAMTIDLPGATDEAMTIDLSNATDEPNTAVTQQDLAEAVTEPEQPVIPPSPQPVAPAHEARATPRYRARWRADIVIDAKTTYYGHLKDISIGGAAVLLEHNIKSPLSVTLYLEVPSAHALNPPHILQVEGKVVDTIYEGESAYFRTGIAFRRFIPAEDLAFLDNHLKNHCLELPQLAPSAE